MLYCHNTNSDFLQIFTSDFNIFFVSFKTVNKLFITSICLPSETLTKIVFLKFGLMNTSFNLILFYGEDSDEIGTLRLCYIT